MRFISISDYNEKTMQLAKPVYDSHRRVLLAANHTIHPWILERLINLGIKMLIVEDAESRGITMEEMLDMPTWMDLIQAVKESYQAVEKKQPIPLKMLLTGIGTLLLETQRRPVLVPVPIRTLPEDMKDFAHAVNVSILALQVGKKLQYNDLQLRNLALGCLLHDIGKVKASEEKKHPEEGFELLRANREINLVSAHVAYQHHEKLDGSGYPRGITAVHEFAQICALANLYENMISKDDLPPHEAMEYIMTLNGSMYAAELVQTFINCIPAYPPGTKVQINHAEEAIVVKIVSHMQRPVVRMLSTEVEIPMEENPTVIITGVI